MKSLFICVIIGFCIYQPTLSSDLNTEFQVFDSLLFQGKLTTLEAELDKFRKKNPEIAKKKNTEEKTSRYYQIISYKDNFLDKDKSILLQFIRTTKTEREYYSKSFAGERAHLSYVKYLTLTDTQEKLDATKYYFIAKYFRARHIEQTLATVREVYKNALEKYKKTDYKITKEYIEKNLFDPGNNFALNSYHDSLSSLLGIVTRKQQTINNKEIYWKSTDKLQKKWFVSTAVHTIFQPEHNNIVFDFTDQAPPIVYTEGLNAKRNNFGFSLEAIRNFSESFGVGGNVMISKSIYRSEFDLHHIYFDYSYNVITTHLKTVYYLRKHVGFRPYVAVGGGYFRANRSESEVKVITITPLEDITDLYLLPKKTMSGFQAVYEFGMQFVTNENSMIFFDVNISYYKNHKDDIAIKSTYHAFAIKIGLLLD